MRKLSRSKILGLVTTGAIVVTTAFSFAAWDTLDATSTGNITLPNKVAMASATPTYDTTREVGGALSYTGDVTFTVDNFAKVETGYELQLTPVVKKGGTALTLNTDYTITLAPKVADPDFTNNTDKTIEATNEYVATVNLVDTSANVAAGDTISVEVAGKIVKTAP